MSVIFLAAPAALAQSGPSLPAAGSGAGTVGASLVSAASSAPLAKKPTVRRGVHRRLATAKPRKSAKPKKRVATPRAPARTPGGTVTPKV